MAVQAGAKPLSEPPTFNDETVALGAAEAAALTQQARIRGPNSDVPDAGDRVTPVSNPLNPKTFFDSGDVDRAMGLFENAIGSRIPVAPIARPSAASVHSPIATASKAAAAPPAPSLPAPRPPHAPSAGAASPSGGPITERPQAPVAVAAPVSLPPALAAAGLARPVPGPPGPTTTRPLPFEPAAPIPIAGLPAELPLPPGVPGLPGGARSVPFGAVPAATAAPFVMGPKPAAPTMPDDGRMERLRAQMAAGELTPAPKKKSGFGAVLLVLLLVVAAGAFGVYVARPDLFEQALTMVSGKTVAPVVSVAAPAGPPIDQQAAVRQLTRIAESAKTCAVDGGPTGPGVASVTFAATGFAESATVSAPYADTAVGKCIETRLMTTRVPPFAGAAVQINKNFFIFASPGAATSASESGDLAPTEADAAPSAVEPEPARPSRAPRPRNVRRERPPADPSESPGAGSTEPTAAEPTPAASPAPATPSEPAPAPIAPF